MLNVTPPKLFDIVPVLWSETVGNQQVDGLAEHLVGTPPEDRLGRRVEEQDLLLLVHGDDAVHCRVENVPHLDLAPQTILRIALSFGTICHIDHRLTT